jgi:hypothetical protein
MGILRGTWIKEAISHTTANLASQHLPWKGGCGQGRCPTTWHTSLEYFRSRALHSLLRKSWVLNGKFMTPCNPVLTEWPQSVCYDTSTPSLCSVTLPLSSFPTLLHITQALLGDDWSVYGHQSSRQFLVKNWRKHMVWRRGPCINISLIIKIIHRMLCDEEKESSPETKFGQGEEAGVWVSGLAWLGPLTL